MVVVFQLERYGDSAATYGCLLGSATVSLLAMGSLLALLGSFFLAPNFGGASSPESSRAAKKFDD